MAARWEGPVEAMPAACSSETRLIVDALFGAGLSKPLPAEIVRFDQRAPTVPVVAIDVPSGARWRAPGQARPAAFRADLTVTFFRKKPGHVLMPGRDFCGETVVADIGIPASVLADIAPKLRENQRTQSPAARARWTQIWRGHAVVVSGDAAHTGAARLAAAGALTRRGRARHACLAARLRWR